MRVPAPNLRLPQTDRPYRWSVVWSVCLHLLLVGFFVAREVTAPVASDTRAPGTPGLRGGGGRREFVRVDLSAYQAVERVTAPVRAVETPPPVVGPIPLKVQKLELPVQTGVVTVPVDVSSLGSAAGPGTAGGIGPGKGEGLGADTGRGTGGEGGDIFPPKPRYLIVPPIPPPASMRGRTIRVHFWVGANGKVTRVRMDPEIKDAAYRDQFMALMREYEFEPARKLDGTRIDGEITVPITL